MFIRNDTTVKIKWMIRSRRSAPAPLAEGELDPGKSDGHKIKPEDEPCYLFLGLAEIGSVSGKGYNEVTDKSVIVVNGIDTLIFKLGTS